jgi:hypothetical protein
VNLGSFDSNPFTVAFSIDERGQIAGYSYGGTGGTRAIRWTPDFGMDTGFTGVGMYGTTGLSGAER